jgi:hypothetical protein
MSMLNNQMVEQIPSPFSMEFVWAMMRPCQASPGWGCMVDRTGCLS